MADGIKPSLTELLQTDDAVIEQRWQNAQAWLEPRFGKQPEIESTLFLIGIQSRGRGYQPKLSKKAKQALIMEGTYCAFETLGLYKRVGKDANGNIEWERCQVPPLQLSLQEQEKILRIAILSYFDAVRNGAKDSINPNDNHV